MAELEPHQLYALRQIIPCDRKKAILAMDAGTGKTLVGLTLIHWLKMKKPKRHRILILAPISLVGNAWMSDNEDFTGHEIHRLSNAKWIPQIVGGGIFVAGS